VRFFAAILLAAASTLVRGAEIVSPQASPGKTSSVQAPVVLLRSSCPCGHCFVAESANFRISWCTTDRELRELAERCELLAAVAKSSWPGKDRSAVWMPKCDVIVHRNLGEYVQALGPGSEQTTGCATIRLDEGRVVLRRIDLRADGIDWNTEALPHELTHVVLADRFCRTQIPPWADEGIALLAESPERMKQRLTELRQTASGGFRYGARDLIDVRTSPQPAFRALFYGQSLALVSLLLDCGSREQLLQFVEASEVKGFDAALRDIYGDRRMSEFEQRFREYVSTDRPLAWARQHVVAAAMPSQRPPLSE
jgi:hypothetical protein